LMLLAFDSLTEIIAIARHIAYRIVECVDCMPKFAEMLSA